MNEDMAVSFETDMWLREKNLVGERDGEWFVGRLLGTNVQQGLGIVFVQGAKVVLQEAVHILRSALNSKASMQSIRPWPGKLAANSYQARREALLSSTPAHSSTTPLN